MPHIEVLPNSGPGRTTAAPGWTYVADTGYDPSKVAINPKDRKRVSQRPGGPLSGNELSARQQTAIARRIAELERDNDPKLSITVPGKKVVPKTSATKKIIMSNKTIKNWLDDEEAMLQQQLQNPHARNPTIISKALLNRRVSTLMSASATPSGATTPVATMSGYGTPAPTTKPEEPQPADDPLLSISSVLPRIPDRNEIETLHAAPPLPYSASYVAPPAPGGPPARHFCDSCGYWGNIRCANCGARVCGMECKEAHEATRCLKWA